MLSICAIDNFIFNTAVYSGVSRAAELPTGTDATPSSTRHEVDVSANETKSAEALELLKRITSRHILCNPYCGDNRPDSYRKRFAKLFPEIAADCFWNEFPFARDCGTLSIAIRNSKDIRGLLDDIRLCLRLGIDDAIKYFAEILVLASIPEVRIVFMLEHTHSIVKDILDRSLLDSRHLDKCRKALDKAFVLKHDEDRTIYQVTPAAAEHAGFLYSNVLRHDMATGFTVGVNLSGISYDTFCNIVKPFKNCWPSQHPYAFVKDDPKRCFRDFWLNEIGAPIENIVYPPHNCDNRNKYAYHDRFIVFPAPMDQHYGINNFIALVFSNEIDNVLPQRGSSQMRKGTCVVRCISDPQPVGYEDIRKLITEFMPPRQSITKMHVL